MSTNPLQFQSIVKYIQMKKRCIRQHIKSVQKSDIGESMRMKNLCQFPIDIIVMLSAFSNSSSDLVTLLTAQPISGFRL